MVEPISGSSPITSDQRIGNLAADMRSTMSHFVSTLEKIDPSQPDDLNRFAQLVLQMDRLSQEAQKC